MWKFDKILDMGTHSCKGVLQKKTTSTLKWWEYIGATKLSPIKLPAFLNSEPLAPLLTQKMHPE